MPAGLYSYVLCTYRLYSSGLYSCGLCSYAPYSYGLRSQQRLSRGPTHQAVREGPVQCQKAYIVMADIVMDYIVMDRDASSAGLGHHQAAQEPALVRHEGPVILRRRLRVMAYIVMAASEGLCRGQEQGLLIVTAYILVAYVRIAYIGIACIVTAYIVLTYVVMAAFRKALSRGPSSSTRTSPGATRRICRASMPSTSYGLYRNGLYRYGL